MNRISDIVTLEEIEKWGRNNIVLINAPTGTGKSYFIINHLYAHCKATNKKILLLTNRKILKEQFVKEIRETGKTDVITILTYQKIEYGLQQGLCPDYYDYVVADECHYPFTDACFNRNTDMTIKWLLNLKTHKILMSATVKLLKKYIQDNYKSLEMKNYYIEPNVEHISKLYFYSSEKVLQKLLFELPDDEKAIYFSSAEKAYNMSNELKDSKFICSENKQEYIVYNDTETKKQIIETERFDCKVLCTTSVLDNGVNIKDKALKHVIVDYFDIDVLIQCIGRKRIIDEDDKINIYIKSRGKRSLNTTIYETEKRLEQAVYLKENGEIEFQKEYGKKIIKNIIDLVRKDENNISVKTNDIMFTKLLYDKSNAEFMKAYGYEYFVCRELNYNLEESKVLENEYDGVTLIYKLDNMVDTKLFKDEQDEFKKFLLKELLCAPKSNHGSLGLKTINGLFEDYNLNYTVESKREKSGEYRDKTYWIISKL